MTRTSVLAAMLAAVAACGATARADNLTLNTDTSWRAIGPLGRLVGQSINAVGAPWEAANVGWNTSLAYDDSGNGWNNAIQDFPLLNPLIIWPDGNGHNGSTPAYFRKTFSIPGSPTIGTLRFGVDDDALVYLNGVLVASDTNGLATNVSGLDVTAALLPGVNLFAVKAHNQQGDEGWVATLDITFTPIPEPTTWLLAAGGGMCCLLVMAWRRQRRDVSSSLRGG